MEYKVHDKINKVRGRMLRMFSEGAAVAIKNMGKYVELPDELNTSGISSLRRYARAHNEAAKGDPDIRVLQVRSEQDSKLSKVYLRATKGSDKAPF